MTRPQTNRLTTVKPSGLKPTASVHLRHEWDPVLTDHPAEYYLKDLQIAVDSSEDLRQNAGLFWQDLIKYHQKRRDCSGVAPRQSQVPNQPNATGNSMNVPRPACGRPGLASNAPVAPCSSAQPASQFTVGTSCSAETWKSRNANVVPVPQEWRSQVRDTHFHMIPPTLQAHVQTPGDSSTLTKDSSQCTPDCIVIDSSECSSDYSIASDCASSKPTPAGNAQESTDRNSVPQNAKPPLRASRGSGRFRGRVGRPRVSSGTSARPISVDSPEDSTSADRPIEPTSSETPRNTTSTPPRRRKARQKSLWYLRYKSESRDPITQKYFCTGCPPGREYKYVNNSQLSRHATQHRFTGERRRYHCFGCKDERKFCRMDALQRHMVKGEMYKECLERGLYSEYDEFGNGVLIEHPIPKQWRKPDPQEMDIDD